MWLKILLPLALIGIIYWMGRRHAAGKPNLPPPQPLTREQRRRLLAGVIFALCFILSMLVYVWLDDHRIMEVRVINIQSGHAQVYHAKRHAIHHRSLETLDGLRVVLADVERMEIYPKE